MYKRPLASLLTLGLTLSLASSALASGASGSPFGFRGWSRFGETAQLTQTSVTMAVLPFTDEDYTTGSVSAQEEIAFRLLNEDREKNGVAALPLDERLSELARLKCQDMLNNDYFGHTSPTYGTAFEMLSDFGYSFTSVAENIAHHATVEKAHAAFLSSNGHRRTALGSQWKKVGIGVCYDEQGFVYVTQLFVR